VVRGITGLSRYLNKGEQDILNPFPSNINVIRDFRPESRAIRAFATVLRGAYGSVEQVEVSAVPALTGETPSYGFVIRNNGIRQALNGQRGRNLHRSVEQLTELVGRVSLKDMVRESSDMIERLCIEAALERSGDNRASAAQMLGLSRQSFYAKMRRHGLGDLDPSIPDRE
jgi:DNA-binding NtrC family response regulator